MGIGFWQAKQIQEEKEEKKLMKRKKVEIIWEDSTGTDTVWDSKHATSLKPLKIHTIGYIWEETKKYIVVIQSIAKYQIARRFTIPKGCIKKITKL